jgi:hypothetical protein
MWCADGDLCKIPQGKKGLDWGYGASKIHDDGQLKIESDDNIILRVGDTDIVKVMRENNANGLLINPGPRGAAINLGGKAILGAVGDEGKGERGMHIHSTDGDLRFMASTEKISIPNKTFLQFGEGYDREVSAGQIAYGRHDGGQEGTLNIVGAGKNGQARVVRVWDALQIGDTHLRQDDDWLRLLGNKNDTGSYNRGLAAKNLWARDKLFVANRDILAELDDLKNTTVRTNGRWEIQSGNGKCLDLGSNNQGCDWNNDWRHFTFRRKNGT